MREEQDLGLNVGGRRIVCDRLPGRGAGVLFLGGLASDRKGLKSQALFRRQREAGRAFVRFDYSGHGDSEGRIEEGSIGRWLEEALAVLDTLCVGPTLLVGSSLGGWLAFLAAQQRPDRVAGIVTVAAAADFTRLPFFASPEVQNALADQGVWHAPSRYGETPIPFTRALLEEARRWLILDGDIGVRCPVRLLHGMADQDIPWETSLALARRLASTDVVLELVKNGDHRLSGEADLARLLARVAEIERLAEAR